MSRHLTLICAALVLMLNPRAMNCQESGEQIEEPSECSDCLTVSWPFTKPAGRALVIQANATNYGVFESSSLPSTTNKWRIICPPESVVHAVLEAMNFSGSDYVLLNRRKYMHSGRNICTCSTPKQYISDRRRTLLVALKSQQPEAATRVHYICLRKGSNSKINRDLSTELLNCNEVVQYALNKAVFGKLAQLILNEMWLIDAFKDKDICTMQHLAATSKCGYTHGGSCVRG